MKTILLGLLMGSLFAFNADEQIMNMEKNTIGIVEGETGELKILSPSDANISIGEKMSRINIKRSEITTQFKSGNLLSIYTRGNTEKEGMPLAIVRLEMKENKCTAQYIANTSKEIKSITFAARQVDSEKMIYKIIPNAELTTGAYCILFQQIEKGNFKAGTKLEPYPCFFEVIE